MNFFGGFYNADLTKKVMGGKSLQTGHYLFQFMARKDCVPSLVHADSPLDQTMIPQALQESGNGIRMLGQAVPHSKQTP
jgi:hypothetical protein